MTPEEWNEAKASVPVGDKADVIAAATWLGRWWRPMSLKIDRCMAEHDQTIFPSTKWSSPEAHLRHNDRNPGEIVCQLPIVCSLSEVNIMIRGMTEIRDAMEKHSGSKP